MLLIYTHKKTNRVRYIFKLIIGNILGLEYVVTDNREEYQAYEGPKMAYAHHKLDGGLFFSCLDLLFERGIEGQELNFVDFEGDPAFFRVYNKDSILPFDIFAASFYLVTRYEEYLPYVKDEHGRFQAKDSLAFQKGFLEKPIVNTWAQKIGKILTTHFPGLKLRERAFKFVPTIDINAAYAIRSKGLVRSVGGYVKAASEFNFNGMLLQTRVLLGLQDDPIDTYEEQLQLRKKYDLQTIYFILFAQYGHNDKNISFNNRRFQVLIKSLADYCKVGLHSSFSSIRDPGLLQIELERLSKVLNREITKVRQHFLVLNMPVTYRNMVNLDISEDYSMGYVNQPGFRAGIADAFNFYDLDLDVETNLRVHPFSILNLDPIANPTPMEKIRRIAEEVKKVDGTLISMWSNDVLTKDPDAPYGLGFYERMIKEIIES
jgi:hypothetical protein